MNEILGGIKWSGKDVTKMPIIGKLTTRPYTMRWAGGEITNHGGYEYEVVEIVENGSIYICNKWYKEEKHIPQIIHKNLILKYIPI